MSIRLATDYRDVKIRARPRAGERNETTTTHLSDMSRSSGDVPASARQSSSLPCQVTVSGT